MTLHGSRGMIGQCIRSLAAIAVFSAALIWACDVGAQQKEQKSKKTKSSESFDLEFATDNGGILLAVRPARILRNPKLGPIAEMFSTMGNFERNMGFAPKDVEQFIGNLSFNEEEQYRQPNTNMPSSITLTKNIDAEMYGKAVFRNVKKEKLDKTDVLTAKLYGPEDLIYLWQPDPKRIVTGDKESIERLISGRIPERTLLDLRAFDAAKNRDLVLLADETYFKMLDVVLDEVMREIPLLQPLTPVAKNGESAVGSLWVSKNLVKLEVSVKCKDLNGARDANDATKEFIEKMTAILKPLSMLPLNDGPFKEMQETGLKVGTSLLQNAKVKRTGKTVLLTSNFSIKNIKLSNAFEGAILAAREAARRTQAANNGKQMALAFHNYADAHGQFPPAVLIGPKGHKYSWRVAMLPFMEQQALYDKYKFDEPWDSKNNLEVMEMMPPLFRHPNDLPGSTNASYFALTGPGTMFDPEVKKMGFRDILDGTSNTIMFVEAKRDIPWTKPVDIEYDPKEELPKFGGFSDGGMNVAMGDGSIQFFSDKVDAETMHKMIQRNDGQVIDRSKIDR